MTSHPADVGSPRPADDARGGWIARRSRHTAKAIKGLLLALAAALALELSTDAGAAALGLAVTVVAVLAAELYEHAVQQEIETGIHTDREAARALLGHGIGIPAGASFAFALFILAWLGIITTELAIDGAIWSGIGFLFALGYAAGRMRGDARGRALLHGLLLALIGIGVLMLKTIH